MKAKRERNLKQISGRWYVDFTFKGRRVRKFGGYTKEQAQVALAKERLDRRDIALGLKLPAVDDVAFDTFADEFLELYSKPNKRSWSATSARSDPSRPSSKGIRSAGSGPRRSSASRSPARPRSPGPR